MAFMISTFLKDLARWRQDPMSLVIWLLIPFMIGGLITAMMAGNNGGGPSGTLLIADLDDTPISGLVAGAFSQDQMAEMFNVQSVSVEEGTALIEAGEASGFLTIPEGFQDAFLENESVTLTLKTNPSQTILPGIIEDVTEVLLDAGFYLQTVFGPEIEEIKKFEAPETTSDLFVTAMALQINDKMETIGPLAFPPVLNLEIVEPPPSEPRPDFALLFLPGIMMMAILFSAQGLSADYWTERNLGTLRRLVSTPGQLSRFVLGKSMAAAVVIGMITGVVLVVGFLYHDVAWAHFIPSLLFSAMAGAGLFAWFAALQMLFPNNKAANLVSTIVVFPLLMMGGSFFPLDALPDWLAAIGRLSPNGFVVDQLNIELSSADSWTFSMQSWAIVAAMALSGMAICTWRLKTGFARR